MHIKYYQYGGLFVLGLCIALLIAPKAQAQNADSSPLGILYACMKLEPFIDRNECYDRATQTLQNAEETGDIVALRADEFRKIQEGVFGYKHTSFSGNGKESGLEIAPRANPLESMTTPVKKVERYLSGYVITLDNNQVWEQFAGSISRVPKGKLSAEIKTTPTGTYKMVLFNTKSRVSNIKVRRIQ